MAAELNLFHKSEFAYVILLTYAKGHRCIQGYTTDRGDLSTLGGQGTRRIGGT